MKKIKLTQGKWALVDNEDFEWLDCWKWLYNLETSNYSYAKYAYIRMHRLIMRVPKDKYVDHIDGNTLNNQKKNLRICSNAENCRNRGKNKNNTSGYSGVYFRKDSKKWRVQIYKNFRKVYDRQFSNKGDAMESHKKAIKKYHGKFARINN